MSNLKKWGVETPHHPNVGLKGNTKEEKMTVEPAKYKLSVNS